MAQHQKAVTVALALHGLTELLTLAVAVAVLVVVVEVRACLAAMEVLAAGEMVR
jgi:hypothetical protein